MVETVLLVRHGKAQSRDIDIEDAARSLTEAGKRSLRAVYPKALGLLDSPRIHIWISPKIRARQTADIVADVLGVDEIDEHPSLAQDSIDEFLAELRKDEQKTVVAVGHDPFLEEVVQRLTGLPLSLEKGGIAAIGFPGSGDQMGELIWFVQGPDWKRWKTLCSIESIIQQGMATVKQNEQRFFDDPEDDETLHKLRVSIRTIRSLLVFIEPYIKASSYKKMQDDLRSLVRKTSRLREWDVLCQEVSELSSKIESHPQPNEELSLEDELTAPDPQLTLYEVCAEARGDERTRVLASLGGKKMKKCLDRAQELAVHLTWKNSIEQRGLSGEDLRKRYDDMKAGFDGRWAVTDFSDIEQTHRMRKDAKKLRYIADGYADVLGYAKVTVSAEMEAIQDKLGVLCDARVAKGIIAHLDERKLGGEAAYLLALLESRQDECIVQTLFQVRQMAQGESE